LRLLR